eukprot:TRINITY_DN15811_c0_g1_i1.p1 TRINITY_DN15811_c0_g1~~TRINITY_DN15811_c0_g1_i1.p1  ORF type:complete len:705 (+),score=235.88 TRINITY_DN15811_c0_g1_i1:61-2175(+)
MPVACWSAPGPGQDDDEKLVALLVEALEREGGSIKVSELLPLCPTAKRMLRGRKLTPFCVSRPEFIVEAVTAGKGRGGVQATGEVVEGSGINLSGVVMVRLAPAPVSASPQPAVGDHECRNCGGRFTSRNRLYRHLAVCEREAPSAAPREVPARPGARVTGKREMEDVCLRVRQVLQSEWRPRTAEKGSDAAPLRWIVTQRKMRSAIRTWLRVVPVAAGQRRHEAFTDEWYDDAAASLLLFLRERSDQFVVTEGTPEQGFLVALTETAAKKAAEEKVQRMEVCRVEEERARKNAAARQAAPAGTSCSAACPAASAAAVAASLLAARGHAAAGGAVAAAAAAAAWLLLRRTDDGAVRCDKESSRRRFLELPEGEGTDREKEKRQKGVRGRFLRWVRGRLGSTRDERQEQWHWAAEVGDAGRLKRLLRAGVDVDGVDQAGRTAVAMAALCRDADEALQLLTDAGADLNIADNGRATPATAAAALGLSDVVSKLAAAGGSLSTAGSEGLTAEQLLARKSASAAPHPAGRTVRCIAPLESGGPAAGSYVIDAAVPDSLIEQLTRLWDGCPVAEVARGERNERRYYCDSEGWVRRALESTMRDTPCRKVFAQMRFLHYSRPGQVLPPHTDLYHTDPETRQRSTHTLILYLTDCDGGGETALLPELSDEATPIARVTPRRGRLLLFPHDCPHMGCPVTVPPKLLLRGEAL